MFASVALVLFAKTAHLYMYGAHVRSAVECWKPQVFTNGIVTLTGVDQYARAVLIANRPEVYAYWAPRRGPLFLFAPNDAVTTNLMGVCWTARDIYEPGEKQRRFLEMKRWHDAHSSKTILADGLDGDDFAEWMDASDYA